MTGRRSTTDNIGLPKAGVTCLADSLVLGGSSVLRMKFCAKNPRLRQPEKRYRSC